MDPTETRVEVRGGTRRLWWASRPAVWPCSPGWLQWRCRDSRDVLEVEWSGHPGAQTSPFHSNLINPLPTRPFYLDVENAFQMLCHPGLRVCHPQTCSSPIPFFQESSKFLFCLRPITNKSWRFHPSGQHHDHPDLSHHHHLDYFSGHSWSPCCAFALHSQLAPVKV